MDRSVLLFNPIFVQPSPTPYLSLTDDQLVLLGEVVLGDLQVERSGSFPYTARDVVMRTVARAEPSSKVASLPNGYATEVGADS